MKKYSDSDDDASDGSFSEASVASASNELTSSKGTDPSTPRQPMRDEVQEIEKASMNDTKWIRRWRLLLIFMLIATAATVTLVTFLFLEEEQDNNYKASFAKFSETIGTAAIQQQRNVINGFEAFANTVTAAAQSSGAVWPYVTLPLYESYARYAIEQTGAEIMAVANIVPHVERESYEAWTAKHYYEVNVEAHMLKNGNLDALPDNSTFIPQITRLSPDGNIPDIERDSYFAVWQWSPPPFSYGVINWNPASIPDYEAVTQAAISLKQDTVWTRVRPYATAGVSMSQEQHDALHSTREGSQSDHPHSFVWHPVRKEVNDYESSIVAVIGAGIAWDVPLRNLLPDTVSGIFAVISNNCNQSFTYLLDGPDALYLGEGDLHDREYDEDGVVFELALGKNPEFRSTAGHCLYELTVYPSEGFVSTFDNNTPEIFGGVVAGAFLLLGIIFALFNLFVQRRNRKLIINAARSNAIVTQLFPGKMRDQVIASQNHSLKNSKKASTRTSIKSFVTGESGEGELNEEGNRPLAELFLETTILFGDIVGFTAWSSTREPSQVFSLLEAVYKRFDEIAKKRNVFKVETVGDCYVAAVGIPEYKRDHAVIMMRFAHDIIYAMDSVTKKLELSLGPDTADLALRIGVHSGPVTAGVLRGERARFQLFGDTMNTTARMESSGKPGFVHVSKETADLLTQSGKKHWLTMREEKIVAKGKGELQTYWLKKRLKHSDTQSIGSVESSSIADSASGGTDNSVQAKHDERTERLITWNTETLLNLLKPVVAHRNAKKKADKMRSSRSMTLAANKIRGGDVLNCLSEVQEIIALPDYDHSIAQYQQDLDEIVLSPEVKQQMKIYVSCIASMYRDNRFHNFEHASHVMMSVTKLMTRIIAPSELENHADDVLHDHTYGITSDPLTQFACAVSALIHDTDHEGVPNATLVEEKSSIAAAYKNRSVAEQNSLDLAWGLLVDSHFEDLLEAICGTDEEFVRFRQLVVNSVMATDIADKDLKQLRNARWDRAFSESVSEGAQESKADSVNRKATIVIEHLIQASDVAHTMQHWHIYRKWNERLFMEMHAAYKAGRAKTHPAEFWYKGEMGFFDFYIIPLAKKLKDCGVFGVSSGEYLNYAMANRREWETRGQEVVEEMVAKLAPA